MLNPGEPGRCVIAVSVPKTALSAADGAETAIFSLATLLTRAC
jgi:hypothetical protein